MAANSRQACLRDLKCDCTRHSGRGRLMTSLNLGFIPVQLECERRTAVQLPALLSAVDEIWHSIREHFGGRGCTVSHRAVA